MPFYSVSCGQQEIVYSVFEIAVDKNTDTNKNLLGFIIIIPPVIMLILSFFICTAKNTAIYNIYKTIFIIAPIFNIFAVFIMRAALRAVLLKTLNGMNLGRVPVSVDIKLGFVLYIIFNAAVFIFSSVNYFTGRDEFNISAGKQESD